jgi:putative flippase GtrA
MNLRLYYQGPFYTRIDHGLIVAYVVSGAVVTVSDFAAFTLCFSVLGLGLLWSTVTAYLVGLVVSYLLNRYWVYRKGADSQSQAKGIWRYIVFLAFNLGLTYAMLWIMENNLTISPYIGKFIVNTFMFFWIYLGNAYWVFAGKKEGPIKL